MIVVSRCPTSVISPAPCCVIAARTSGASATRSTSICAFGLARMSAHTLSATSVSSALMIASATSSLVSVSATASCTAFCLMTRTTARSTAGDRSARTIASSSASSSAASTPVTRAAASVPRAAAPSNRLAGVLLGGGSGVIRA